MVRQSADPEPNWGVIKTGGRSGRATVLLYRKEQVKRILILSWRKFDTSETQNKHSVSVKVSDGDYYILSRVWKNCRRRELYRDKIMKARNVEM